MDTSQTHRPASCQLRAESAGAQLEIELDPSIPRSHIWIWTPATDDWRCSCGEIQQLSRYETAQQRAERLADLAATHSGPQ